MLHYEIDRTTTFAAAETLAYPLRFRHMERRRAFIMERTQTDKTRPAAPQVHKIAHHLNNVGGVDNPLHSLPVNLLHVIILTMKMTTCLPIL